MPTYKNHQQLMDAIKGDVSKVMVKVGEYAQTQIRESVQKNVYDAWEWEEDHPRVYNRTYQFLNSWVYYPYNDGMSFSVYNDHELMDYNADEYQHGGFNGPDRRENLDDYIQEGTEYDFFSKRYTYPRDYWNPFIDWVENQDVLAIAFSFHLAESGAKFVTK